MTWFAGGGGNTGNFSEWESRSLQRVTSHTHRGHFDLSEGKLKFVCFPTLDSWTCDTRARFLPKNQYEDRSLFGNLIIQMLTQCEVHPTESRSPFFVDLISKRSPLCVCCTDEVSVVRRLKGIHHLRNPLKGKQKIFWPNAHLKSPYEAAHNDNLTLWPI